MTDFEKVMLNDLYRRHLLGKFVPNKANGAAGRKVEQYIKELGVPFNQGFGEDIVFCGWEVRTREIGSQSAITFASITLDNIIKTEYKNSNVYRKMKKILFISTQNNVIVKIDLHDLTPTHIQEKIEESYNRGKEQIIEFENNDPLLHLLRKKEPGKREHYLHQTSYKKPNNGYFENSNERPNTYKFRMTENGYLDLVASSNEFDNLLEFA